MRNECYVLKSSVGFQNSNENICNQNKHELKKNIVDAVSERCIKKISRKCIVICSIVQSLNFVIFSRVSINPILILQSKFVRQCLHVYGLIFFSLFRFISMRLFSYSLFFVRRSFYLESRKIRKQTKRREKKCARRRFQHIEFI